MTTQDTSHIHVRRVRGPEAKDECSVCGEAYSADLEAGASTEPDEPGEGALTRTSPSGGFEIRVTPDHGEAPIAEQMERTVQEAEQTASRPGNDHSRGG